MLIFNSIKTAEEMGLPKQFAVRARQRYLTREKNSVNYEIKYWAGGVGKLETASEWFCLLSLGGVVDRYDEINKELDIIKRMGRMKEQEITDEMIASARNYPVDKLVDFGRSKKAKAFCHEDKNPSMYHGTRINKAMCPVCNKAFDSISILMKRDGYSFIDAVKELSGRS